MVEGDIEETEFSSNPFKGLGGAAVGFVAGGEGLPLGLRQPAAALGGRSLLREVGRCPG